MKKSYKVQDGCWNCIHVCYDNRGSGTEYLCGVDGKIVIDNFQNIFKTKERYNDEIDSWAQGKTVAAGGKCDEWKAE